MKDNIDIPADQAGVKGNSADFEIREEGVFWNHNGEWKRLSNRMKVFGLERDRDGNNWSYLIEATDDDGIVKEILLPRSMLAKNTLDLISLFLDNGITVAVDKQSQFALKEYILQQNSHQRIRRVSQVGWTESGFLLGAEYIGPSQGETVRLDPRLKSQVRFCSKGSLEDWKTQVALRCRGNSRLIVALSSGLAGPIAGLLLEESGGIHLYGGTSIGKSTALQVCASVLGDPAKIMKQWRTTSNAAEATCAAHNNLTLVIDEMGQANPTDVGEMIYMIGNGKGKGRLDRDARQKHTYEWQLFVLSSGEVDVAGYISASDKRQMRGGQLVRLIDVPADAGKGMGIFEDIQRESGPEEYARKIKHATSQFFGSPILRFLEFLVGDRIRLTEECRNLAREFYEKFASKAQTAELKRKCRRFGVIYAGGTFGVRSGVLPFSEGEIYEACASCFEAVLREGVVGLTTDEDSMVNQVRHVLQLHDSNFRGVENDKDKDRLILNQYGYVQISSDTKTYYVEASVFKKIFSKNFSSKALANLLKRLGHLEGDSEGKNSVSKRFDGSPKRYYAIRDSIFE